MSRSFVIGTAGHVDHGKTTLVHALTGVATDRLPEEKRRGISIELGFAPLELGDLRASVVDVPGHRRFVPTMIAGASGIDAVLLVVAADEGVMPQTREHVAVCELLELRRGVVALTKCDRVDDDTKALAEEEVRSLLAERIDAPIVRCAAPRGEGLVELRVALAKVAGAAASARDGAPKLWVDRVVQVRGAGTVVTGTLVRGRITRGDTLSLATARGVVRFGVRGLQVHGAPVEEACASTRLAIQTTLDAHDVARGDLVTTVDVEPTNVLDVSHRGTPIRRGARATLHVGTSSVSVSATRVDPLAPGVELLRLVLDEPRPIAAGERLLLRGSSVDAASGALLGGGVVLDARPSPRSRGAARRALAEALHAGDAERALEVLVQREDPRAFVPASARIAASLDDAIARAGSALVGCGGGVVRRGTIGALAARARAIVVAHAAQFPLDRGLPLATLRERLAHEAGAAVAEAAILAARARRGPDDVDAILVDKDVVVPAAKRGALPATIAAYTKEARALVADAAVHGVSVGRLVEVLGVPIERARAIFAALEREGTIVRAGELWFVRTLVDDVRERVHVHLVQHARITVIEMKALCGLPRRQAILLLEHLDALGTTRREGDARVAAGARP